MPTIAMFMGILISMHWDEHLPPHFHAWYQGHEADFTLDGKILSGKFPPRQSRIIDGWAAIHQEELAADWEACRNGAEPFRIDGYVR